MANMLKRLVITDPKEIEAVMAVRNSRKGAKSIGDLIEPTSDEAQNERLKKSFEEQYRSISTFIHTIRRNEKIHTTICKKFIENGFDVSKPSKMTKYKLSLYDENDLKSIVAHECTLLSNDCREMTDDDLSDDIYSDDDAYWLNECGNLVAYLKKKMPCATFAKRLITCAKDSFVDVYAQVICTNVVYRFYTHYVCDFGDVNLCINSMAFDFDNNVHDEKTLNTMYDTCSKAKFKAVKADMMKCEKFIDTLSKKLTMKEDTSKEKDHED